MLSLLDADDRALRIGAAWVCCLVAVETDDKDVVGYLVERLGDRLSRGPPVEVTQAPIWTHMLYIDGLAAVYGLLGTFEIVSSLRFEAKTGVMPATVLALAFTIRQVHYTTSGATGVSAAEQLTWAVFVGVVFAEVVLVLTRGSRTRRQCSRVSRRWPSWVTGRRSTAGRPATPVFRGRCSTRCCATCSRC